MGEVEIGEEEVVGHCPGLFSPLPQHSLNDPCRSADPIGRACP